jgi:hypothetical protein
VSKNKAQDKVENWLNQVLGTMNLILEAVPDMELYDLIDESIRRAKVPDIFVDDVRKYIVEKGWDAIASKKA